MSTCFSVRCERASDRRVNITLEGVVTKADVTKLEATFYELITEYPRGFGVLIDFTTVESCEVEVRHVLLRFQRTLAARGCRTAYVANRPRVRGIALWVIHTAGDNYAKSVGTLASAETWLNGAERRIREAESMSSQRLDHINRGKKRRW